MTFSDEVFLAERGVQTETESVSLQLLQIPDCWILFVEGVVKTGLPSLELSPSSCDILRCEVFLAEQGVQTETESVSLELLQILDCWILFVEGVVKTGLPSLELYPSSCDILR